jgi:hypothetical protein
MCGGRNIVYLQWHEEVGDGGVHLPHSSQCANGAAGALALLSLPEELERRTPYGLRLYDAATYLNIYV